MEVLSQSLDPNLPHPVAERLQLSLTLTFNQALELFDVTDHIALDTETNGKDVRDGSGRLYGISLAAEIPGVGVVSTYLPFYHPPGPDGVSYNYDGTELQRLKEKIESYTGWLIFHNAKFDLESLRTVGINYTGKFYCTMLMVHLINENLFSKSLEACCRHYLNEPGKKESPLFQGFLKVYGWENMIVEVIYEYGAGDAIATFRLFRVIKKIFDSEELTEYWEYKQRFFQVIRTMERRGIRINEQLCTEYIRYGTDAMADVVELLDGANPNSSKFLESFFIGRLGLPIVKPTKGTAKLPREKWKPSFDKEAMEIYDQILERKFGEGDPVVDWVLTYRGWMKSVSSNYKPYLELLGNDGRLHPNYKLHGTKTGRMSCEKPNLQQIPRAGDKPWNGKMKKAFIPMEGYTLWEFDYGQLELRLATAYADETLLKRIFEEGRDVFTEMSQQIEMARHDTKTLVYTIQYGGGITRLCAVFGFSPDRAAEVRENFYATYPGFRIKTNAAKWKAERNGKLRLWSGRYRHFMFPKSEGHKAFNSVIQGGAADIVERIMVRLFDDVDNDEECRMLLQVHDSVVFEIKNGMDDIYIPRIKSIMERPEPDFGVKFKVDAHIWGE